MLNEPTTKKVKENGNGRGTVWKLPSGRWRWQVTLGFTPQGKRLAKSGTEANKTLADTALAQAIADYSRGLLGVSEDITLSAYADKWLSRQKGLRASSIRNYKKEMDYALKHLGKLKLKNVKPHHIKDCLTTLSETIMEGGRGKGKPMSSRTLGKVRTRLKAIFREAVSDGLLYVNPMDSVKRVKGYESEPVGIALDEVQMTRLHELGLALYNAGVSRLFPAIFTAASVGLRRGEVMGLRWEDIDLERNVLKVRKSLTVNGGQPELGEVKTRRSKRDVPIPLSLKNILVLHREKQAKERERAETAWTNTGAVFATELGDFTHPDNLNRALLNLCQWSDANPLKDNPLEAKVTEDKQLFVIPVEARVKLKVIIRAGERLPDLTPHDLRHTAATLMLKRKTPVEVVSRILGHARVSITLDIYRHVLDAETEQAMPDLFDVPLPVREVKAVVLN
jgi:integrase